MKKSAALLLVWGATALACGSDDSSGGGSSSSCASNPQSCPATQTCWVIDLDGRYGCVDAPGDKVAGTACEHQVGQAQCAPGLGCFPSTVNPLAGTCSPFCQNGSCADGAPCANVFIQNKPNAPTIQLCQPSGTGGTGGAAGSGGGGTGGGGTGGAAGSSGSGGTAGATGGAAGSSSGGTPSDAGSD